MATDKDYRVPPVYTVELNSLPILQNSDSGIMSLFGTTDVDLRKNESGKDVNKADATKISFMGPLRFGARSNLPTSSPTVRHWANPSDEVVKKVCHVCDTHVPEVIFNEHKSGCLPDFDVNIAATTFKRHLQGSNNINNKKLPSKYFCVECSRVINREDEMSHEKTTAHRNCVLLERFFNELKLYYTKIRNEAAKNNTRNDELNAEEILTSDSRINSDEQHDTSTETLTDKNEKKTDSREEDVRETEGSEKKTAEANTRNDVNSEHVEESNSPEQENFSDEPNAEEMLRNDSSIDSDEQHDTSTETLTDKNEKKTDSREDVKDTEGSEKKKDSREEDVKNTEGTENSETLAALVDLNNNSYSTKDLKPGESFLSFEVGSFVFVFKALKHVVDGFIQVNAQYDICMVCNKWIDRADRVAHVKTDDHQYYWPRHVIDYECIRKIANSLLDCVLCNILFKNYKSHVNSDMHRKNYRASFVSAKINERYFDHNKQKKIDNSKDSSRDANKKTGPAFKIHATNQVRPSFRMLYSYICPTVDLEYNVLCDICNDWSNVKKNPAHRRETKHVFIAKSEYHYLLQNLDEDNLVCKICKVSIPNVRKDIVNHCTKSKHIKKYRKLLKAESMSKIDEKLYYCAKCKEYILHKNEIWHIESKEHIEPKEQIDTVGLMETVVNYEESGGSGRPNDPGDAGDGTEAAALVGHTGRFRLENATDNLEAKNNENPILKVIKYLSGCPKIDYYITVDPFFIRKVLKGDQSVAVIEDIRMLKSLLNHLITLRRQKDAA